MPQRLTGKVAIVTGSSRGIGRAVALAYAREGASVVINYSGNKAAAQSTAEEAQKHGGKALVVQGDVSSMEDTKKLIETTIKTFGRIDILALNAGLILLGKDLKTTTPEDFDLAFSVNVKGPLFTVKEAEKYIPDGGRVIFFSSSLLSNSAILPAYMLYVSTKGAIEQLCRVLAKDLGKRSVTVNTIAPGPTATDGYYQGKPDQLLKMIASSHPTGRIGKPEEIADAAVFLASPESAWVNGQVLKVNGGSIV